VQRSFFSRRSFAADAERENSDAIFAVVSMQCST
jgi:hypothetical protein